MLNKITKKGILEFIVSSKTQLKNNEIAEFKVSDNLLIFIMREDFGDDKEFCIELLEGSDEEGYSELVDTYGWTAQDNDLLVDYIYNGIQMATNAHC